MLSLRKHCTCHMFPPSSCIHIFPFFSPQRRHCSLCKCRHISLNDPKKCLQEYKKAALQLPHVYQWKNEQSVQIFLTTMGKYFCGHVQKFQCPWAKFLRRSANIFDNHGQTFLVLGNIFTHPNIITQTSYYRSQNIITQNNIITSMILYRGGV